MTRTIQFSTDRTRQLPYFVVRLFESPQKGYLKRALNKLLDLVCKLIF